MPDKDGASPEKEAPKIQFNYELGGQVVNLLEGLSADELDQIQKELATDETVEEGKDNAVTEAEKAPEVKGEPIAETKAPEPEPEAAPEETPGTSVDLKFKIKRHGKEVELDLAQDPDRLKTLIALGFDYTQKTQELAREREYVLAHKKILESERFKEFLQGEQAEGRFTPEPPPQVDKAAMTEYAMRKLDDDFDLVRERMAALAASLGPEVEQVVDSDHMAFVRMYDRVAQDVRKQKAATLEPKPVAAPKPKPLDAQVAEKILKTKEVLKTQAVVEVPGGATEQVSELDKWKKRDAQLARKFRESKSDEDAIALVMHRQYIPT